MKINKFAVVGPLGNGAQSAILQIRMVDTAENFALKVVPLESPEDLKFKDQAEHEFKVAQMFDHPNLIKIFALEPVKDWLFRVKKMHMLIEFVDGKTIDEAPRLSPIRVMQVFEQVASALVHMHKKGVFHADIKPNNIMLSKEGVVKVIDFGLSWIRDEPKDRIQGTPEYMAPEQAKHKMVNERTDIYSLGASIYKMITGKLPPPSLNDENKPIELKTWQKQFKPVDLLIPTLNKSLAELINRCLSFQATARPERMSEVQGTLDRLVEEQLKNPNDGLAGLEW